MGSFEKMIEQVWQSELVGRRMIKNIRKLAEKR